MNRLDTSFLLLHVQQHFWERLFQRTFPGNCVLAYVFVLLIEWLRWYKYILALHSLYLCLSLTRLGFLFWINKLTQEGEKTGKLHSSECFTYGSEKTLIHCILIPFSPPSLTQKNLNSVAEFCSNYLFIRVAKMTKNKSQLFKEVTWVVTLVCYRLSCKSNIMQTWFLCFVGVHLRPSVHYMNSFLSVRPVDQRWW